MPSKADDLIAALDIGSSKIACAIAQPLSDRTYRIVGMGVCGSVGVREGVVVEINPLVKPEFPRRKVSSSKSEYRFSVG